jgi:eukaryotic-like serine/threonine-protein kinase
MNERDIFVAAIEKKDVAQRAAYLDQACGDDVALCRRVQVLLKAHEQARNFLDSPAPDVVATINDSIDEGPGTVIGPYKLLQKIGEGGMGIVFMAEQTRPVQRKVALKVIKPGMDSRQVIARFEAERQALAMMDHVNIARVLDAGATESGRPYFVMELVHGVPITEYCDDNHLTPRERLELFVPVCQAIQHAHQKGIIHRDIKPSNVMITLYDGKPGPKVIDFGVANATEQKLTERTLFTQYGALVGTLEYMSPEQAEMSALGIDTRSDIFSLGVLLYELLTGSTPLSHKRVREVAYAEVLRLIQEEEPPKPSTRLSDSGEALAWISAHRQMDPAKLSKLMRGELDWIVMKCLEKDRGRRYETANGFAADVQRYLNDETVWACPPSARYRLRKFARRNKAALVMVSVVTLAVLLVVGSLGWMARDRTAREQEIAQDRATRQALIKERVTLALDEARKRHQEGRWREALDAAKRAEALAVTGESDEETHEHMREVLGDMQMLANLDEVRADSTKNEAGLNLEDEDSGNARAFREYGIDIDALDRDVAARRIRARSIGYELTAFLDSWSHVRRRLVQLGSTPIGKDWRELLEVARAADSDPWRDRFRKAVLNDDRQALIELTASAPISSLPADTVDRLGDALMNASAIKEAAAFLKLGQRLHPRDYWINVNLASCLLRLGPQQRDDAIRYLTVAVALRPEAAFSHDDLGKALAAQGNWEEAIACFRKSIELNPQRTQPHIELAAALGMQGKPDEAAAAYREANRLKSDNHSEAALAPLSERIRLKPDDAAAWNARGRIHQQLNQLANALADHAEAIRLDPKRAIYRNDRALAYVAVGQWDKAAADYDGSVELDPKNHETWRLAAYARLAYGDVQGYRRTCSEIVARFGQTTDPVTAERTAKICSLAPEAVTDFGLVEQLAQRSVTGTQKHEYYRFFVLAKGLTEYRAGRDADAVTWLNRFAPSGGGEHWDATAFAALAMAQSRLGRTNEANDALTKANAILAGKMPDPSQGRPFGAGDWHDWLMADRLYREAEALLTKGEPRPKERAEAALPRQ